MSNPFDRRENHLSRRSFGLLGFTGATAAATAAATVAGASTASAATISSAATTSTFRVGHLNILYSLSNAAFLEDLNLIAGRSDLLGLNEVAGRRDELSAWAANHDWMVFQPAGSAGDDALLARKSVFARTGDTLDRDSIFVGDAGDGVRPAYLNWASWLHLPSGRRVNHIGTHVYSDIDNNGTPGGSNPAKLTIAKRHFQFIRELAGRRQEHGQVVVTGDFNVDYVDDRRVRHPEFPYTVLEERQATGAIPGLRSGYSQHGVTTYATHGDRRIDYIYDWVRVPEYRVIRMTSHGVVRSTNSDHNGLAATFTVTH